MEDVIVELEFSYVWSNIFSLQCEVSAYKKALPWSI